MVVLKQKGKSFEIRKMEGILMVEEGNNTCDILISKESELLWAAEADEYVVEHGKIFFKRQRDIIAIFDSKTEKVKIPM